MLDLVRGYFTTSMALYPDEKRTWQELHHILLLQQMLEHFLKGWPVLFVLHLDSKVAHSDTVWILHLLQITEHSFTHRQGFINVNGAQVYKLRLVYCPNINASHCSGVISLGSSGISDAIYGTVPEVILGSSIIPIAPPWDIIPSIIWIIPAVHSS